MGLIKRYRQSQEWRREEADGSLPSLSGQAAAWLDSKPAGAKKAALAALAAAFTLGLAFTVGYGAMTVAGHQDSGYSDSSEAAEGGSSRYAAYFQEMDNWPFLRTSETIAEVEDSIYGQLLAGGLEEGEFVVVQETYEQVDGGYVGYFRDTPRGKTWKAVFQADGWSVAIEESELPLPAGADLIEEDDAESEHAAEDGAASDAASSDASASEPSEQAASSSGQQDAAAAEAEEEGISLSDASGLAAVLPARAAAQAPDALVSGVSESYGFTASASKSCILPSTVKTSGESCSFTAVMRSAQGDELELSVSFDAEAGRFTGSKL